VNAFRSPLPLLAQVVPTPPSGGAATPTTATVSLLLLVLLAAYFCVKQKGAQWPHIGVGVAIGVLGASTFIGTLTWSVLNVVITIVNQIGASFG
jgi:hypothetical protein